MGNNLKQDLSRRSLRSKNLERHLSDGALHASTKLKDRLKLPLSDRTINERPNYETPSTSNKIFKRHKSLTNNPDLLPQETRLQTYPNYSSNQKSHESFPYLEEANLIVRGPKDNDNELLVIPIIINGKNARLRYMSTYNTLANGIKFSLSKN